MKRFIIQDNKKVIEKILYASDQMTRTDEKITLVNIKFHLNACNNLPKKELNALSDTATHFFSFYSSFRQQAQN